MDRDQILECQLMVAILQCKVVRILSSDVNISRHIMSMKDLAFRDHMSCTTNYQLLDGHGTEGCYRIEAQQ